MGSDHARREQDRFIDQIADRYLVDDWSVVSDVVCSDSRRVVWASNEATFLRGGQEMHSVILFNAEGVDVSHFFLPSRPAAESIFTTLVHLT